MGIRDAENKKQELTVPIVKVFYHLLRRTVKWHPDCIGGYIMKKEHFLASIVKKKLVMPSVWFVLAVICVGIDYLSGPLVQFPIVFLLPVALSSWYGGKVWGILYSLVLPIVRMLFTVYWAVPWTLWESIGNTLIRMTVFSLFAVIIERVAVEQRALSHRVKVLEGLLPVCSFCKKIRNEKGDWEKMEKYITEHSEAEFSHGLCPECLREHYPEYCLTEP